MTKRQIRRARAAVEVFADAGCSFVEAAALLGCWMLANGIRVTERNLSAAFSKYN